MQRKLGRRDDQEWPTSQNARSSMPWEIRKVRTLGWDRTSTSVDRSAPYDDSSAVILPGWQTSSVIPEGKFVNMTMSESSEIASGSGTPRAVCP